MERLSQLAIQTTNSSAAPAAPGHPLDPLSPLKLNQFPILLNPNS